MEFPPSYTRIFQLICIVLLAWNIGYFFVDDEYKLEWFLMKIVRLVVCLTALISYLNDKGKMLIISKDGLLFEECDVSEVKPKLSFLYLIVAILYNPIFSLFYSEIIWLVTDVITASYFTFRNSKDKK